jgi:tRNA(fMet)-specific endonuclease VapC
LKLEKGTKEEIMNRVLVDTDILSYYLKGEPTVINHFESYLNHFNSIEISLITYYEIFSGLLSKNAFKKLSVFEEFIAINQVLPLTTNSAKISAEVYASLKLSGKVLDDIDLLFAGIAIENDMTLATNNEKHFGRIPGLKIENWRH